MNKLSRKNIFSCSVRLLSTLNKSLCTQLQQVNEKPDGLVNDTNDDNISLNHKQNRSVLDTYKKEDIEHVAPYLKPTFNFAAYVNKSETLQELLKLGVNLHKLEKQRKVPEFILSLNFDKDIKGYVTLLHDLGVPLESVGYIITKNPFIFKESIDNIKVRINYLESKKFTPDMIIRILSCNPFWLSFSTREIDKRLGNFQKKFALNGNEVRELTIRQPRLITYDQWHVKKSIFTITEEMGFNREETKQILLKQPKIFMNDHNKVLQSFDYLHNYMKITQEIIVKMPEVLSCRHFRLKQRFEYLQKLNKVQFNPKQPGYISPLAIVTGDDIEFCANVAKTPIESYNTFLKTL